MFSSTVAFNKSSRVAISKMKTIEHALSYMMRGGARLAAKSRLAALLASEAASN
jgi:hypothetical protein